MRDQASPTLTPAVNLLPSALTAGMPQIELGPATDAGSLRAMAQSGDLVRSDGSTLKVHASVVPDLIHNQNALPGSDVINAGSGSTVVFGDYGLIGALPTTGIPTIDTQLQGLSVSMMEMLSGFSALSTAQDALENALGTSTRPFTISAGNNTITGSGTDTIFGAGGEYLVPGVSFPMDAASTSGNALAFDSYLLDMQQIVGDMSFVTHEAGEQVISAFATATGFSGSTTTVRPATHLLNIDNNTIDLSASSGNNLVVGGTGFVIMPGVTTPAPGVASVDAGALQQLESSRKSALAAHFATDHPITPDNSAAAQWLFGQTIGFQINIGNDHIVGGAGDDILIGDNALILQPVSGSGSPAGAASGVQATMVSAIDRLFLGNYSAPNAMGAAFGAQATLAHSGGTDWSLAGGYIFQSGNSIVLNSDTIDGGPGADHIYGDLAVMLPQLGSAGVGTVGAFNAYPSSELGGTLEADYNYVYGFGPFGSLHPSRDPRQTSAFTVDADTIQGGAGNDVLFGELGNDNIDGGAGDDLVSGGFGFNRLSGGTGTNQIAFDRSRDTYVNGGGNDIARSSLNLSAGSPILSVNWQSAVGSTIGNGMLNPTKGPLSWTGNATAPAVYQKVLTGPFVTVSNLTAARGQVFAASSLFTAGDLFGGSITQYAFYDATPGGGHFQVGSTVEPSGGFFITAAQYAQTVFIPGTSGVSDHIYVAAYDGFQWSAVKDFYVSAPANTPAVMTASDVQLTQGQTSVAASNLFSASDPDGDTITQYAIFDASPGGGHFQVGSTVEPTGGFFITAAEYAQAVFVPGLSGASDHIYVAAYDGFQWSAVKDFYVSAPANTPAVMTASDVQLTQGQTSVAASNLFTASDPDGDAITHYAIFDATPGGGHFQVGSTVEPRGGFFITAAEYAQAVFVPGLSGASDHIYVAAYDGFQWSAVKDFYVSAPANTRL